MNVKKMGRRKRIALAFLIIILAITASIVFSGCIGSTTIYELEKNPDKYIDKSITIDAKTGFWPGPKPDAEGFWIQDTKTYGEYQLLPDYIFVTYSGDAPSTKDKWGRQKDYNVRVKGTFRYTTIGRDMVIFYIDGESWEYR